MGEPGTVVGAGAVTGERLGTARDRALRLTGPGPVLYGLLFVVVLPAALVWWAAAVPGLGDLPALQHAWAGLVLLVAGLLLWLAAVRALRIHGGGLPLNAYPPPRYVSTGPYALVRHPIYTGFGLAAAGVVLLTGSRAGLWLVLPVLLLSMVALVAGFETPSLHARFGPELHRPLLSLPRDLHSPAEKWERAAVYLLVLLPWLLGWSVVQLLGRPADAFTLELPLDRAIPVLPWTWYVYATTYLLVPAVPLLLRDASALRRFSVTGLLGTAVVLLVWLTLPVLYLPRPFTGTGVSAQLLELDRRWCTGMAAFPSFHVLWALLVADACARQWPKWRSPWWLWAGLVTLSCLTTGMHGILDIAAAVLLFLPLRSYDAVWERVRSATERLANSWREWHLGPVRIINHGLWAGLAGAVAAASLLLLAPTGGRTAALAVAVAGLLGAGIWAQLLESSSGLLRPFGYYGAVFGTVAVGLCGRAFGYDGMLLLSALATGAPWVQLLGRCRCLVQGCCHGHIAPAAIGIRYRHPRSRVSYLAGLAGEPLHATPLYSIASNLVAGIVLARLWWVGAPQALIIGVYLIGNGLARFVEEGFRGEPQTPTVLGLRLYQWLAMAFVIAGAATTTLSSAPSPEFMAVRDAAPYIAIALFGLLTGIAMGVDFPASNRRFSRLAT